jgi:hypothetical protein
MKTRKIMALIITLAMLLSTAFIFSAAADSPFDSDLKFDPDLIEPMPMPAVPVLPSFDFEPEYGFAEGIIEEITDNKIHVKTAESEFYANISDNTYSISIGKTDRRAPSAGDSVRVFYDMAGPMIMIYPPQYTAEFIAVNLNEDYFVKIARFDEELIDPNNTLKLNISEAVEIILEDGAEFTGGADALPGRKLIVIYSASTRSIPAIATPEKIIVMYEKAVPPALELTEEEKAQFMAAQAESYANADIAVNGGVLQDAPRAFLNKDGILMVPVRAIAEALGERGYYTLPVDWHGETRTVTLGRLLSFQIGQDSYAFARMAPAELGAAPVLKTIEGDGSRTFVPIDLFMMLDPALFWYYEDGRIVISDEGGVFEWDGGVEVR